jgi:MFS family permease
MMLSMPVQGLLPIFVDEDHLDKTATGLGILSSIAGVGAIVVSIALASLANKRKGLMLLAGSLVLCIALIVFSFSSSWTLSLSMFFVFGLGQAMRMTLSSSLIMHYTEAEYRGRVMSVYTMNFSITSLGTFAAALLAEGIGIQWAVGGFAMALMLITLLVMVFVPRIRKLD